MAKAKPNLLFVFADQLRGMALHCAGETQVHTPTFDRLAEQGVRATHAFSNAPVCGPARASLLSGRYPLEHGVIVNDLPLPHDLPTIGEVLRAEGYRTGYIGKWHLDGVPRWRWTPPGSRRHGFDTWAAFNCSHRYYGAWYYGDDPEPIAVEGYEPEVQTDLAIEFLKQDDERPFALVLSWGPPHDPYNQVPDAYRSLYDPQTIELRPNVRAIPPGPRDASRRLDPHQTMANYYAAVTALDAQMARLLGCLDDQGLSDHTLVVFTSDHGDMLFSQGLVKKQLPWEESISVPLIARWPGAIPAGRRCDALIGIADVAPTVLGLMGVSPIPGSTGRDFANTLKGGHDEGQDAVFLMDIVPDGAGKKQGGVEWRGIRTSRYTYARRLCGNSSYPVVDTTASVTMPQRAAAVVSTAGTMPCSTQPPRTRQEDWLLYDNIDDPYQMNNLIGDPACQALRRQLSAQLDAILKERRDPFLSWSDHIQRLGLVEVWNRRERDLLGPNARLLQPAVEGGSSEGSK